MLGSINTGGFSKSQVDAMKDSNYFNRKGVLGVYDPPNPKAPVVTGSFLDDDDDDAKGFLDAFLEGYQSYNPENILKRGYSIALDDKGLPLKDSKKINTDDIFSLILNKGKIRARKFSS